jgi:hypothetical protein
MNPNIFDFDINSELIPFPKEIKSSNTNIFSNLSNDYEQNKLSN